MRGETAATPTSDSGGESPNLSFLGFPVTNSSGSFVGPNAYGGQNANGVHVLVELGELEHYSVQSERLRMVHLADAGGLDRLG